MVIQDVAVFENNERAYLTWLEQHADGFVINTTRGKDADYMVLHRARCYSISSTLSILGGEGERVGQAIK